jgi:hypothetical protein
VVTLVGALLPWADVSWNFEDTYGTDHLNLFQLRTGRLPVSLSTVGIIMIAAMVFLAIAWILLLTDFRRGRAQAIARWTSGLGVASIIVASLLAPFSSSFSGAPALSEFVTKGPGRAMCLVGAAMGLLGLIVSALGRSRRSGERRCLDDSVSIPS